MFEVRTDDPARLRRIVAASAAALLLGLAMVGFNALGPLVSGGGYGLSNLVFGLFGVAVVVWAAHPTYEAIRKLDGTADVPFLDGTRRP